MKTQIQVQQPQNEIETSIGWIQYQLMNDYGLNASREEISQQINLFTDDVYFLSNNSEFISEIGQRINHCQETERLFNANKVREKRDFRTRKIHEGVTISIIVVLTFLVIKWLVGGAR